MDAKGSPGDHHFNHIVQKYAADILKFRYKNVYTYIMRLCPILFWRTNYTIAKVEIRLDNEMVEDKTKAKF